MAENMTTAGRHGTEQWVRAYTQDNYEAESRGMRANTESGTFSNQMLLKVCGKCFKGVLYKFQKPFFKIK